jgi:hypothetical protein
MDIRRVITKIVAGAQLKYYVNRNALPWEPPAARARDELAHKCLVEFDKKPLNNEGLELEQERLS